MFLGPAGLGAGARLRAGMASGSDSLLRAAAAATFDNAAIAPVSLGRGSRPLSAFRETLILFGGCPAGAASERFLSAPLPPPIVSDLRLRGFGAAGAVRGEYFKLKEENTRLSLQLLPK